MKKLISVLTVSFLSFAALASIDSEKSEITWKGTKKIGESHSGTLKIMTASASKDKTGRLTGGEFVIDMDGIDVTDLTGNYKTKFLTHMKSDDFFDVKKYPTAKLKLTKVMDKTAKGELTIKDKTMPVEIPFTREGEIYIGTFTFDRTKWGVIYGSGNFFKELAGDKIINNDIELKFEIVTQ